MLLESKGLERHALKGWLVTGIIEEYSRKHDYDDQTLVFELTSYNFFRSNQVNSKSNFFFLEKRYFANGE